MHICNLQTATQELIQSVLSFCDGDKKSEVFFYLSIIYHEELSHLE